MSRGHLAHAPSEAGYPLAAGSAEDGGAYIPSQHRQMTPFSSPLDLGPMERTRGVGRPLPCSRLCALIPR